tara:strand:+ start:200 stop:895 length:696 start_codon:yes stop_codon:yes gene_type:complete
MNVLSVIPARGGSKSIPKKNIQILNGYPLIKYSIDYSLKSKLVTKTIVSTDDKKIADISIKYGAIVPFMRPKEFAKDHVQDLPVFIHALEITESFFSMKFDLIILLRPTSPLRPPDLIEKGIKLLKENPEGTSVRAVKRSEEHPYRQWFKDGEFIRGYFDQFNYSETYNLPRQKLNESFFQTGDIEIIRRETLKSGSICGKKVIPIFIKKDQAHDIDNIEDLLRVKNKLNA